LVGKKLPPVSTDISIKHHQFIKDKKKTNQITKIKPKISNNKRKGVPKNMCEQ